MHNFGQLCFSFAVFLACAAIAAWNTPVDVETRTARLILVVASGSTAVAFAAMGLRFGTIT